MRKIMLLAIIGLTVAGTTLADTAKENEILAGIVQVLNSLKPRINEAQLQHDDRERLDFNYDELRADLERIQRGISHKFQQTLIEPRVIQPINGDYLTVKSKQKRSV